MNGGVPGRLGAPLRQTLGKVETREFAEVLSCCQIVSPRRAFWIIELTDRDPPLCSGNPGTVTAAMTPHSLETQGATRHPVVRILQNCRWSEIGLPIVERVTIPMIIYAPWGWRRN